MLGNVSMNPFGSKPLPSPKGDKLPPLPPSDHSADSSSAPPPPPKATHEQGLGMSQRPNIRLPPPIDTSMLSPNDGLQKAPITPLSPMRAQASAPSSPGGEGSAKKKGNPLSDFIETEKAYVELLTGIIRKVASAWSRQNLPPPELDKMFRSIESVYKANRALLAKLKEIGTDPESLKALGDLLMKWIEDLESPYTKYCTNYCSGYDFWAPVQSNERLRTTLATFSSSNPPPMTEQQNAMNPSVWTLDELFLLPKHRLRYYRKLYSRLLKSTTPGRSDHRVLSGALEKLDSLLGTLDERASVAIGAPEPPVVETEDEVVIDLRTRNSTMPPPPPSHRASDSTRGSDSPSVSGRSSQDTAPTTVDRGSSSTMSMPVTELERRLSTDRTLDIFTMQPKQVRLQITPPGLHYSRELRISADVVLNLIPRSTGVEITQERGHIFILTDLLLICERMTSQELARSGPDGPDMWLLYPPLAGKHLRIAALNGSDTALAVTILRKETVIMYCETQALRDKLIAEFMDCVDRAALLQPGKNQAPPPPVPQLPPSLNHLTSPTEQRSYPLSAPNSPPMRAFSPTRAQSLERALSPPGTGRMGVSDDNHLSRMPPLSMSSSPYPPRTSSAASGGPGAPFGVGQIMPGGPTSFGPGQVFPQGPPQGSFQPGQVIPPPRGTSYRSQTPQAAPLPNQPGLVAPPGVASGSSRAPSPYTQPASRPPSDGSVGGVSMRTSTSSRSLTSPSEQRHVNGVQPPMPAYPDGLLPPSRPFIPRSDSSSSLNSMGLQAPQARPLLPSAQFSVRSIAAASFVDPSPPSSPVEETPQFNGPTTSAISAQMKCKVFLQEHHAKWKSLGAAKLKLYHESPTNVKQLVVEADNSKKNILISTIVLEDGVERVGKTGIAIELSDQGQRTGVVYMIQLRNESAAVGLFKSLLAGSDRAEIAKT